MSLSPKYIITFLISCAFSSAVFAQSSPAEQNFKIWENYSMGVVKVSRVNTQKAYIININTQSDLNNLTANIRNAISKGQKIIEVQIAAGVFFYDKPPILLNKINAKDISIFIKGNNTILVAGGRDYKNGGSIDTPSLNYVYLDEDRNLIDLYGEVNQAAGKVVIVDKQKKECQIPVTQSCKYTPGMRIQLSEWYKSPVYKVTEVRDDAILFIANDLKYDKSKKCYNVQYDNAIASINPRFRFVEVAKAQTFNGKIHECIVSQFIKLIDVQLNSFSIYGISFCGGAKGDEALFYFKDVSAESICLAECQFYNIKHRIIRLKNTRHFVFRNNIVKNCYAGALYSDYDCPETIVKDNYFYRAEKGWTNSSCVVCYGEDFLIADNVFEDISYSSIRSGHHLTLGNEIISKGVIENNEIVMGEEYYNHPEKYSLVDGGAIYLGTLCKQVIVRYNYIHNYRGVSSNRAIYCDDGAMNVKIYGNIISGVTNSHSIFSWRSKSVNKKYPQSNDGIDVYYNVICGRYKFDERPKSSCVHGKNLILYADGARAPENVLNNFAYKEKDLVFSGVTIENGKVIIPSEAMKELKKFPTYQKMKHWLE